MLQFNSPILREIKANNREDPCKKPKSHNDTVEETLFKLKSVWAKSDNGSIKLKPKILYNNNKEMPNAQVVTS